MRRVLGIGLSAALAAASITLVAGSAVSSVAASVVSKPVPRANATVKAAGPQHWCGTNGIECTEPALNWDEFAGFDQAKKNGAHISGYIGHDEPADAVLLEQAGFR